MAVGGGQAAKTIFGTFSFYGNLFFAAPLPTLRQFPPFVPSSPLMGQVFGTAAQSKEDLTSVVVGCEVSLKSVFLFLFLLFVVHSCHEAWKSCAMHRVNV